MAKLISKVYGDALFQSAKEAEALDRIYQEISDLKLVFEQNPGLLKILESPKISREEKADALKAVFSGKISEMSMGFLMSIIEKCRQNELYAIFDYFIAKVKEDRKIGIAFVSSASELSGEQKEALVQKLISTTEYEVFEMHYQVEPDLLGGLRIRIKDRVVDSTIKNRLYQLKQDLLSVQMR
ncbi:MAG: ATP synthase F1 subunit delta [Johnsonella sp.]|nr:ATP synthase F1 subunit delta [Johnsonella sp.]